MYKDGQYLGAPSVWTFWDTEFINYISVLDGSMLI